MQCEPWMDNIHWILKVFHLKNDAVNPIWLRSETSDSLFKLQAPSTFTRILYSPFTDGLSDRLATFSTCTFGHVRTPGQNFEVLIFCFYTCGLTEGAHRNHFVWDWPNYVARPHRRQICKISSTAFSATTSYDLIRSVSYGNVTLMTVWCESLIAPLSGSYMCSYIVARPWN